MQQVQLECVRVVSAAVKGHPQKKVEMGSGGHSPAVKAHLRKKVEIGAGCPGRHSMHL